MIVVDTNVIVYLLLPGDFTQRAEALLKREPDWSAPVLWRSEMRNVLATLLRQGRLTLPQATAVQAEAESLLAGAEYSVASPRVLELSASSDCSAYDCEFVALAEVLDVTLYTLDARLLRAFPARTSALPAR